MQNPEEEILKLKGMILATKVEIFDLTECMDEVKIKFDELDKNRALANARLKSYRERCAELESKLPRAE